MRCGQRLIKQQPTNLTHWLVFPLCAADSTALLGELVSRGLDTVYWTSLAHMTTISVESWASSLDIYSSRWLVVAAGAQAGARSPAAESAWWLVYTATAKTGEAPILASCATLQWHCSEWCVRAVHG
jgi:hypothetical protein